MHSLLRYVWLTIILHHIWLNLSYFFKKKLFLGRAFSFLLPRYRCHFQLCQSKLLTFFSSPLSLIITPHYINLGKRHFWRYYYLWFLELVPYASWELASQRANYPGSSSIRIGGFFFLDQYAFSGLFFCLFLINTSHPHLLSRSLYGRLSKFYLYQSNYVFFMRHFQAYPLLKKLFQLKWMH